MLYAISLSFTQLKFAFSRHLHGKTCFIAPKIQKQNQTPKTKKTRYLKKLFHGIFRNCLQLKRDKCVHKPLKILSQLDSFNVPRENHSNEANIPTESYYVAIELQKLFQTKQHLSEVWRPTCFVRCRVHNKSTQFDTFNSSRYITIGWKLSQYNKAPKDVILPDGDSDSLIVLL